jgi:transcriptional regulator with XRE-family HTH domain
MDCGNLLREIRRRHRLSQRELAALSGTAKSTLARIESTGSDPPIGALERILAAVGLQLAVVGPDGG